MSRTKSTTYSRKQRRQAFRKAGYLKIKNIYGRLSGPSIAWYNKMRQDGSQLHEDNVKRIMDDVENQLQSMLNSIKETWSEMGYNKEEIDMLAESWTLRTVKNKDTYREDKKNALALLKKAAESKRLRQHATN